MSRKSDDIFRSDSHIVLVSGFLSCFCDGSVTPSCCCSTELSQGAEW